MVARLLIVCLLISFFNCQRKRVQFQDVLVYKDGEKYRISSLPENKTIGTFESADQALQNAIDQMPSGGTIELLNGNYDLRNTVYLKNGINIEGKGRRTKLFVNSTDSTGVGLFGRGLKEVNVSDLSIVAGNETNAVAGICYDHCGDSKVENVFALGFAKYGIWLRNNSFLCHINNSTAANNKLANIYADSLFWSRAGEFMPNLITNCITYAGGNGIETNKSIVLNIVGCVVHQPENHGFYIRNVSNSVLISGCRTYQTQSDAVVVDQSHEINITGNIFCWSRGKGIVLRGVDWGTITGNNIIDSGSERYGGFPGVGDAIGIELTENTRSVQITGNNIFNWGGQGIMKYALYEDESCENNSFTSLNLNYYEEGGVISKGKNSLVKDVVYLKSPALNGVPEGPDPLFDPERLQMFIREN